MRHLAFCPSLPVFRLSKRRASCALFHHVARCCAKTSMKGGTAITWNVNSLRALLRKDANALQDLVDQYDPDVLCLQETKLQPQHEILFTELLPGYTATFNSSTARLGYSGTVTFSKMDPPLIGMTVRHHAGDAEGRMVEITLPGLVVVNVYTMNAGSGLKRLSERMTWDSAFRRYIRVLRRGGKPVLVLGDLNVARTGWDVFDEGAVAGQPGYSAEERLGFEDFLESCAMVDAFRMLYPEERQRFTYWDYKSRARNDNRGWRIDYALVSEDMARAVRDVRVLDEVLGSDHCPVAIDLAPGFLD